MRSRLAGLGVSHAATNRLGSPWGPIEHALQQCVPVLMYDGDSVQMMETHGVMFVNAKQLCFHAAARTHTHTLSLRQTLLKWFEVLNVLLNRKPGPGPD